MSEDAQPAGIVPRPLELDPERAGRAGRAPYAIIDIGSNSVRLVVYDQLGRAPALVAFGAALLGWIAGGMAISDPVIAPWANANAPGLVAIAPALVAAFVWLNGLFAVKEAGSVTIPEPPARPAPLAPPQVPPPPEQLVKPAARAAAQTRVMIAGVVILAIAAGAFLAMVAYLDSYLTRGAAGAGADASSQAGAYRP